MLTMCGASGHMAKTLKRSHELANTLPPRIQVTLRFSKKKQLEFLDVHTSIVNNVVTTYLRHRKDLKSHLQDRRYNANFIEDELGQVDAKERTDLLIYNNKENKTKMVPLVITFSRALPNIRGILWKHIKMLHTSDRMKQIFTEAPILAFKREKKFTGHFGSQKAQ